MIRANCKFCLFFCLLFLLAALSAPLMGFAQQKYLDQESIVRAKLLVGQTAIGSGNFVSAAIQIDMQPKWHTYWRSPGESGFPPQWQWQESENLAKAEILWPAPQRFYSYGKSYHGYQNRVIFPLRLQPQNHKKPLILRGVLRYGVCREICLLQESKIEFSLPPGAARMTKEQAIIRKGLRDVPLGLDEGGLEIKSAIWREQENQAVLQIKLVNHNPDFVSDIASLDGFVEIDGQVIHFAAPVFTLSNAPDIKDKETTQDEETTLTASFAARRYKAIPKGRKMRLTLTGALRPLQGEAVIAP